MLVNRMRSLATIVRPESLISEEALDPDDNFLIAICEAGSANNLVTGDQRAGLLERRHIGATETHCCAIRGALLGMACSAIVGFTEERHH